jgi:hypothetical protein
MVLELEIRHPLSLQLLLDFVYLGCDLRLKRERRQHVVVEVMQLASAFGLQQLMRAVDGILRPPRSTGENEAAQARPAAQLQRVKGEPMLKTESATVQDESAQRLSAQNTPTSRTENAAAKVLNGQLPRAQEKLTSMTESPAAQEKAAEHQRTDPKPNLATSDQVAQAEAARPTSAVKGVKWDKRRSAWHVQVQVNDKNINQWCKPAAEHSSAMEKAKLQAEQKGRMINEKERNALEAQAQAVPPTSTVTGVTWERNKWHVQAKREGVNVHVRFVPDNHSPSAVEKAKLQAEQTRRELVKERD